MSDSTTDIPRRSPPVPLVLAVIGLGAFFTALDQTVVVTVLPAVMLDLRIPITEPGPGVLDCHCLPAGLHRLYAPDWSPGRRLRLPPGLIWLGWVGIFAGGSVLVALSGSLEEIIGARVIQAIGGAAAVPIGFALAAGTLPPERRGLALGIVGGAAEAGSDAGAGLWRSHCRVSQLALALLAEPTPSRSIAAGTAATAQPTPARR